MSPGSDPARDVVDELIKKMKMMKTSRPGIDCWAGCCSRCWPSVARRGPSIAAPARSARGVTLGSSQVGETRQRLSAQRKEALRRVRVEVEVVRQVAGTSSNTRGTKAQPVGLAFLSSCLPHSIQSQSSFQGIVCASPALLMALHLATYLNRRGRVAADVARPAPSRSLPFGFARPFER